MHLELSGIERSFTLCLILLGGTSAARGESGDESYFEKYILSAVEELAGTRAGLGYANFAYTQDLSLGPVQLKAGKKPYSMCVAAQVEVMVTALNHYVAQTGNKVPHEFLPEAQWRAIRGHSFRGMVWLADRKVSRGTAHALATFGMGEELGFSQLVPGSFVNLNRSSGTGHAVVFLGYIDQQGALLDKFSEAAKGFKYFSSQGTLEKGGFGYRYAFFEKNGCPTLPTTMKRDCGVIFSGNRSMLNAGRMFSPTKWRADVRDKALKADAAAPRGFEFDAVYLDGRTTDD